MSAVILSARGVNKRFGAVVAAADINIDIASGERVSLIGSNGAGKTTFVNMITGYLKPDSGHIHLAGGEITPLDPRAITRLGVARSFQIPQLYGELTVLDNMLVAIACHDDGLSFWRPAHRPDAVARADALLDRFPALVIELHDWLFPFQGRSRNFLRALADRDFEVLIRGENLFCFLRALEEER